MLPAVSLGLWHNFGSNGNYDNMEAMCRTAFDNGITHFDLANNYGPVPGILRDGDVTSVLIGASRPSQILDNIGMLGNQSFSREEREKIDEIIR